MASISLLSYMVGVTSGQLSSVQALPDVNWQEGHTGQLRQLENLKLRRDEALIFAGWFCSGLFPFWPAGAARCRL